MEGKRLWGDLVARAAAQKEQKAREASDVTDVRTSAPRDGPTAVAWSAAEEAEAAVASAAAAMAVHVDSCAMRN